MAESTLTALQAHIDTEHVEAAFQNRQESMVRIAEAIQTVDSEKAKIADKAKTHSQIWARMREDTQNRYSSAQVDAMIEEWGQVSVGIRWPAANSATRPDSMFYFSMQETVEEVENESLEVENELKLQPDIDTGAEERLEQEKQVQQKLSRRVETHVSEKAKHDRVMRKTKVGVGKAHMLDLNPFD